MAWKNSICPSTVPSAGEEHEFEYCINKCNSPCLPRSVLYNMIRLDELYAERKSAAEARQILQSNEDSARNKNTKLRISVTSLQYCLRKNYYNTIYDYAESPTNRWSLYRGTTVHSMLEPLDEGMKDYLWEWKFEREIEGVILVGKIDAIDFRLKRIEDHKTIKDTGQSMRIKKGVSEENEEQINIYRWLAAEKYPEVMKFDMVINYVSMGQIVTSNNMAVVESWRKDKPGNEKGMIKKEKTDKKRGPFGKEQTKWNLYFQVPKVKKWTEKRILKHLGEKIPIMRKALLYDIVPPHIGKNGLWLCDSCVHKERCGEYETSKEII